MEEDATEDYRTENFCAKKRTCRLISVVVLLCASKSVLGVVLHPDGEPNLVVWTDRPDANVVGRWGSNASCVAVSSNSVITTRHQGGDVNTPVEIGGHTYLVSQIWSHSTADLRVAKLYGANLTGFVSLYTNTNEQSKSIVVGGYGKGRGSQLDDYGYTWAGASNQIQRWGQNIVDYNSIGTGAGCTSYVIVADFDRLGVTGAQQYEAALAVWDSGGGWFIYDGNQWKIAGLSRGVEHSGESWYNPPDEMDAVRVSSYASWISQTIPPTLLGDLTGDEWVDFADFVILAQYWQRTDCQSPDWCAGADDEPDGDIDWADLSVIADGWLCDWGCY
jgi:hypothetical protein